MGKIRLLLYCCKQPHKLFNTDKGFVLSNFELGDYFKDKTLLNGKIVAECDYEVEEIRPFFHWCSKLENETCLSQEEVLDYLDSKDKSVGNPKRQDIVNLIHIKNLNIFDKPRELSDCYKEEKIRNTLYSSFITKKPITKAPQNMCRVWIYEDGKWVMYILISVRPEWVFLELKGEKEIEIRKKVLKEMLE